jgi:hypothetical protein
MLVYSVNALEKLLKEKNWNLSDLTREYAKLEAPELSEDEGIRKFGSKIRRAVNDPDHTSHGTIKKLIEILGGELVVRVKRVEELSL